ncbi:unnamed protein product [Sphenostylis stenocarpa]|uniref:Uncharacterized protein n=1 Tax=Sphenostylis stenocarpa TaxID=92480 RepID=A0AA86SLN8_9FABA|nr:unnamed protein product [Sphenostylis stenocarpa]
MSETPQKKKPSLPPKRGQIKAQIFSSLVNSVSSTISKTGESIRNVIGGNGGDSGSGPPDSFIKLANQSSHSKRSTCIIRQHNYTWFFFFSASSTRLNLSPISLLMDRTYANRKGAMVTPRRGRIRIMVFKSIAAVLLCSGRRKEKERSQESGGAAPLSLSSTSTTPPVPSGYSSDA